MGKNDKQNIKIESIVLAFIAFFSVIWALLPPRIVFESASVCIHYKLLGVQCPFCGLSRAGYAMLHLDPATAWGYNPLIFYVGWLYAVEWGTLSGIAPIQRLRKISWWTGGLFVLLLYGHRLALSTHG